MAARPLPLARADAIRRWGGEPTPLQLALASGHRWLATRESGEVQSLREIARREGVDSFVNNGRVKTLDPGTRRVPGPRSSASTARNLPSLIATAVALGLSISTSAR